MPVPFSDLQVRRVKDEPGTIEITLTSVDGTIWRTRVTDEFTPHQADRLFCAFHALMLGAVARDPFMADLQVKS